MEVFNVLVFVEVFFEGMLKGSKDKIYVGLFYFDMLLGNYGTFSIGMSSDWYCCCSLVAI